MSKPRIFLGSSGKQHRLIAAMARGLSEIAIVEPWTTSFNPGVSTLDRLVELTGQVDFAAFVFAQDDWTEAAQAPPNETALGQASPRDNVVFEAGLFGGALGMRRTFILHAEGAKLPSDLLGLTCVRYAGETPSDIRAINAKLRTAIESEQCLARIEGAWWQFSLTERTAKEPSAVSLLKITRDGRGALHLNGRAWRHDGRLSAHYWSEAANEKISPAGLFYYWKGERPLDGDAPQLHGTGQIELESEDRATGYFTTRSDSDPELRARTAGVYWRAELSDVEVLEGRDDAKRAALIAQQLRDWTSFRGDVVGSGPDAVLSGAL